VPRPKKPAATTPAAQARGKRDDRRPPRPASVPAPSGRDSEPAARAETIAVADRMAALTNRVRQNQSSIDDLPSPAAVARVLRSELVVGLALRPRPDAPDVETTLCAPPRDPTSRVRHSAAADAVVMATKFLDLSDRRGYFVSRMLDAALDAALEVAAALCEAPTARVHVLSEIGDGLADRVRARFLTEALEETDWHLTEAARRLNLASPAAVIREINRYPALKSRYAKLRQDKSYRSGHKPKPPAPKKA